MKRDTFIKLIQDNFQKDDQILFCVPDNFITQKTHIRVIPVEKYSEKDHKFIEEKKKVITLMQ